MRSMIIESCTQGDLKLVSSLFNERVGSDHSTAANGSLLESDACLPYVMHCSNIFCLVSILLELYSYFINEK